MRSKSFGVLAAGAVLAFAVAGNAQNFITIPVSAPMTGPIANNGLHTFQGAEMAAEELNKTGGLKAGPWKGYHIKLEKLDDRAAPAEAANIAQQLVLRKDVLLAFGPVFSGSCLAVLPIYEPAGMALVSPMCSNRTITERGYKTIVRLVQNDIPNGIGQADLAIKTLGGKKIGMLYPPHDYGAGTYKISHARGTELGVEVVPVQYNEGETDYAAAINVMRNAKVDLITHFGFQTEAVLQFRQMKQQGLNVPFLVGPGSVNAKMLQLGGADVEGAIGVDFLRADDPNPKVQELVKAIKDKYNDVFSMLSRNGYDGMKYVIAALETAPGNSRADVLKSLRATQIRGLAYDMKVDETGNLIVPMDRLQDYLFLKQIQGGKWIDYAPKKS